MIEGTSIEIRHEGEIKTIENVYGASKAEYKGDEGIVAWTVVGIEFFPGARFSSVGDAEFPDEYDLIA